MKTLSLLALTTLAYLLPSPLTPDATRSPELQAAVDEFSATTSEGGPGWEAYADFLHADFTRWRLEAGSSVMARDELVEGVKEWWEQGSCVGERESDLVSLRVLGNVGLVRRNVSETYLGPDGNVNGKSRNHVTQVWVRNDDIWQLMAMDLAPREAAGDR